MSQIRQDVNVSPIGGEKWRRNMTEFKTGFNLRQPQGGMKYQQALKEARLKKAYPIIYID